MKHDDRLRHLTRLRQVAADKLEQGHDVSELARRLTLSGADLEQISAELNTAPIRDDWAYLEPDDLEGIRASSSAHRSVGPLGPLGPDVSDRIRGGFLGSVCGCILGKPVEFDPTLDELRSALERIGDWPLRDYVSVEVRDTGGLRMLHADWTETVRERIQWVAPDDDINYTLVGVLALERHGRDLTHAGLAQVWLENLPVGWTFGPERTVLARLAALSLGNHSITDAEVAALANWENPGEERCGAMIRADAYGYAFPGDPEEASRLAWFDASLTHRRTGVYGAMFAAALIAGAFVVDDPIDLAELALQYVPQRSRFHRAVSDCLELVARADDWLSAYKSIHAKYGAFGHCRIYQETGTLLNTLRFAEDVGHGICLQVSQGNDTDSYGATAGAVLGVRFGTAGLEQRWLEPFRDRIHTTVATLHETSLSAVADRVASLPISLGRGVAPAVSTPPTGWMG